MIKYVVTLESKEELDYLLWGGAEEKWRSATEAQKEEVWNILEEMFNNGIEADTTVNALTSINDFVWFSCDDIFYPNEEDEED